MAVSRWLLTLFAASACGGSPAGAADDAGTGGADDAGTDGADDAGTGGADDAGTGGADDAGIGGADDAGTGGADDAGIGGADGAGTGGAADGVGIGGADGSGMGGAPGAAGGAGTGGVADGVGIGGAYGSGMGGAPGAAGGAENAGNGGETSVACSDEALHTLEAELADRFDAVAEDSSVSAGPNMALLLAARDGRRFIHAHGDSTPDTSYESASTSKLVTAVVLLDLVDEGVLSLDSKPYDLIPFWRDESSVTLAHLLSFRSGFNQEPLLCINAARGDFESCVQTIYEDNLAVATPPGSEFHYSSTHLQIAGLMAVEATGDAWSVIFDAWKAKTGLFPTALYDLPSSTNPRLAGGMHWTGAEYLEFLEALLHGTILSDDSRRALFANQRGAATVTSSPVLDAIGEDWSYGFGNWLECPGASGNYDCGEGHRNSSPGAYGAYPFIDFDHDYVGIVAREGALGTFREGLEVFRAVETLATEWAEYRCPTP